MDVRVDKVVVGSGLEHEKGEGEMTERWLHAHCRHPWAMHVCNTQKNVRSVRAVHVHQKNVRATRSVFTVLRSFHAYPHKFVGFNNTSTFCLVSSNCATSFPVRTLLNFTRHCCWHRNFQLSTSGFHCELAFFIVWFNEAFSSQLSDFLRALFIISLNSSSPGSMK